MSIIFLDIDGVIATDKEFMSSTKEFHKKYEVARELKIPYRFNEKCVKVINSIIRESDAEIILTSDWRLRWDLQQLNRIFTFNRVLKSPIGATDNDFTSVYDLEKTRAGEIEDYIYENRIRDYVIVDDLNLIPHLEFSEKRFVHCKRSDEGIKQGNLRDDILNILIPNRREDRYKKSVFTDIY